MSLLILGKGGSLAVHRLTLALCRGARHRQPQIQPNQPAPAMQINQDCLWDASDLHDDTSHPVENEHLGTITHAMRMPEIHILNHSRLIACNPLVAVKAGSAAACLQDQLHVIGKSCCLWAPHLLWPYDFYLDMPCKADL